MVEEYKFKDQIEQLSYEELIQLENVIANKMIVGSTMAGGGTLKDLKIEGDIEMAHGTMFSSNFVTGVSGWRLTYGGDLEANNGTFRGTITGGLISIGTSPNLFITDINGNSYWGLTTEQTIDSYSEINKDNGMAIRNGSTTKLAQSFINSSRSILTSCKFYLEKSGSPTGNAVAKLYAHSGVYGTSSVPTGSPLATSDNFDVSTLTTSYQLIIFNFSGSNQYEMSGSTYYCISIEYSGGNASNYIVLGFDWSSPTHLGNMSTYIS